METTEEEYLKQLDILIKENNDLYESSKLKYEEIEKKLSAIRSKFHDLDVRINKDQTFYLKKFKLSCEKTIKLR